MTLTAMFESWCPVCNLPIEPGEVIEMTDDEARHAEFGEPIQFDGETPCPECHLIHAGECF